MTERINIPIIIKEHFKTFRDFEGKTKMTISDKIWFLFFPLLSAILLSVNDITIKEQIGNLFKALAIFGAFSFNLLALTYNILDKVKSDISKKPNSYNKKLKLQFSMDLHVNISFNITLIIFLLISLLTYSILEEMDIGIGLIQSIIMGINYFLLIEFLITLLLILYRLFIILHIKPFEKNKKSG